MNISILGCGWLGLPAALELMSKGYKVKGSTTRRDKLRQLEISGVHPWIVRVNDRIECSPNEDFWEADLILLNIPPGRADRDRLTDFPNRIRLILNKSLEYKIGWILFVSSTSVYPKSGGMMEEKDAGARHTSSESGEILLKCEKLLNDCEGLDVTTIRFGGLYGIDRHPVKYLSGRTGLKDPAKPVNLIHRDDCVRIIAEIVRQEVKNETFNAVSDMHPSREEFYTSAARYYGLDLPEFQKENRVPDEGYRTISNRKLKERLNYRFLYPDPMDHPPIELKNS